MFDSVAGVEPQSETVWRQADKYRVPRLCFINKMDRVGANFYRTVGMLAEQLGATPLVLQLPIGAEAGFAGIIDLLKMKAIVWKDETLGAEFSETAIPADLAERAAEYRADLVELAVEQDEVVLDAWLGGIEPSIETLKACVRRGTIAGDFVPVTCGAAFKNKGVQPLLDAVVDYLPSPIDIGPIAGMIPGGGEDTRQPSDDAPFAGLAFKVMNDPLVGSLTFLRIYSGRLENGAHVLNATKDQREHVGRMLLMHANMREDIHEAFAGDIVALASLEATTTGETLCDPKHPIALECMEFPEPVIEIVIEPRTRFDREKLSNALARLAEEDPSFGVALDAETGQTVIRGMGELHLEIIVDRVKREFKVDANVGAPQVAYRETITRAAEIDHTHRSHIGIMGQYARVKLGLEPGAAGSDFIFESANRRGRDP